MKLISHLFRISFWAILVSPLFTFAQTVNFSYTGSMQTWVVPPCVTSIQVTMAGADGGGTNGGNGAVVTGTLTVTPGQTLNIYVGGSGGCPGAGWNGGGVGQNANSTANRSCGGGGATDIRIGGTGLANRVMVAGGGGGQGGGTEDAIGGNGGCGNGTAGTSPFGQGGGGASTSSGGSAGPPWISSGNPGTAGTLGQGGNGGTDPCYNNSPGGGGGGGYYGGGGGGSDCFDLAPYGGGSGGGGSSLVPAGGGCTAGSNNGAGYVTITYTVGTASVSPTNTGPYCVGATIQLNAGGSGTSYAWTGPNGFSSNQQNPTLPATAAAAGTYNITLTSGGCTATGSTTVVVNPLPAVNAGADQTICQGAQVTLTATGATSYSWNNGVTQGVAFTPPLGTTTYTVTGTTSGCTNTDQVNVTVNPPPTVNAGADQTVCQGTAVTLSGSGATTYAWNNGVTNGVAFNPPVGTTVYTLTGTTAGCSGTDQVSVTVNPSPAVNAGADQTVCQGAQVTLTATGASSYSWNNGVFQGVAFTPPVGTTVYTVTGTTAGCTGTDQVSVTVNPTPAVNAGPDQTICQGAQVTLTATGATSYAWNNGVSQGVAFTPPAGTTVYTVTGTTAGCTATDQVSVTVNASVPVNAGVDQTVCQGTQVTLVGTGATTYAWNNSVTQGVAFTPPVGTTVYTVTGTTAGCTGTDQVSVTVNPNPVVNAGTDQVICQGGVVTLTASGATSYAWSGGVSQGVPFSPPVGTTMYTVTGTTAGCTGTDQVSVTVNPAPVVNAGVDQSVCQGTQVTLTATGATSYSWNNSVTQGVAFTPPLGTTVYTVTGTAAGCTATDQVSVTVSAMPVVNAGVDQTVCQGSQVTLSATGATSYAWSGGVSQGVAFNPALGTTVYSVTGTTGGCSASDQVSVTVNPSPIVNAGSDQTVCQGTQVTLTGTGATSYSWTGGVSQGVAFNPPVGTTIYTVTGTSAGCSSTDQVSVTVNAIPVVNAGPDQTVCLGTLVTLTGTGATSYSWTGGVSQGVAFNPPAGTTVYTVTGTTAGCTATDQVSVTVNTYPTVDAGVDQTVCQGTQVILNATGASNYAWSGGVNQGVAFTPPVGTNVYTVTSSNSGCSSTDQVTVTVNAIPNVNAGADQTVCEGTAVTLSASGSSGYSWDNGISQGVPFVQPVGTTVYTVTAAVSGCSNTDQVSVTVNPIPAVDAGQDVSICFGGNTTLTASGATSYAWSPGGVYSASMAVNPSSTTVYTVTGTSLGCTATDQVTVTVNPNPTIDAGPDVSICAGEATTLTASGGQLYLWNPGALAQTSITVTPASTTVYTVDAVDINGCTGSDQVTVTVNSIPNVDAGPNQTLCAGQSITMIATGQGSLIWSGGLPNGTTITPGQDGWYFVTATTVFGCENTDSVFIAVEHPTIPEFLTDVSVGCVPLTVEFTNNTPGGSIDCIWQIDGTTFDNCGPFSYTFNSDGYYDITLTTTSPNGCEASVTVDDAIYVAPMPVADFLFSPVELTELNPHVNFHNTSINSSAWIWDFGDGSLSSLQDPMHDYPQAPGTYNVMLIAISPYNCIDTVMHTVVINEEVIYYVPNAFTPDGDNYNQDFKPIFTSGFDPYDYHLTIFNRWGEILFESYDAKYGWDGTYAGEICADGSYVWKVEFKVNATDERVMKTGHVSLMR